MKKTLIYSAISIAILGITGLSGCGSSGGGSGGSGGGGGVSAGSVSTSGVITGFGSVFVDGVEFETDNSSFSLDDGEDGPESEDELEVGMVVTVTGTVNADGVSGDAVHIEYDDELEGIVFSSSIDADGIGTMDVMGQTVSVDNTTIFESDVPGITEIQQVVAGNVVEVSGFSSGDGNIFATRIEVESATHSGEEIEVKGIVADLTATTFTIGGLTVDYSGAVLEVPNDTLSDGLYVEVKSTAGIDEGTGNLIASEVELEDDGDMDFDGDEGDETEIKGIVTAVNSDSEFEIDGKTIIITDNTQFEHGAAGDIKTGILVEAEGGLDENGAMLADEIEFEEDSNIEMEGKLEAVSGSGAEGTVTVFGQTITVTTDTIMIDESDDAPEHFFSLDDLVAGVDNLEIEMHRNPDSDSLIADKLERDEGEDAAELEGPVESIPDADHIVIAGVTVDVSGVSLPDFVIGTVLEMEGSYDQGTGIFTATGVEIDD